MIKFASRLFRSSVAMKRIETFMVPQPGEGIAEVEIVEWKTKTGQSVREYDLLCEARTDKGFIEYKSPFDGVIKDILIQDSETVLVGSPLYKIDIDDTQYPSSGEAPIEEAPTEVPSEEPVQKIEKPSKPVEVIEKKATEEVVKSLGKALATPSCRHLAKQMKVDIKKVTGTGDNGRVLKEDILAFAQQRARQPSDTVVKMSSVHKAMVRSMTQALSIPHLTYSEDINMDKLIEIRNSLKNKVGDLKLTFMHFMMKAMSIAILDYPMMNSEYKPETSEILIKGSHNISFALDTKLGLLVPNVKNCEEKSVLEICKEMNRIQRLGEQGRISADDLSEGTISLSNVGTIGGVYSRPIILAPQVAIGALGAVRGRLEMVNGQVVEKKVLASSWSADHRIIDGATTARFVSRLKELIEEPSQLILQLK